jgi:hypothetical protein
MFVMPSMRTSHAITQSNDCDCKLATKTEPEWGKTCGERVATAISRMIPDTQQSNLTLRDDERIASKNIQGSRRKTIN